MAMYPSYGHWRRLKILLVFSRSRRDTDTLTIIVVSFFIRGGGDFYKSLYNFVALLACCSLYLVQAQEREREKESDWMRVEKNKIFLSFITTYTVHHEEAIYVTS